MDWRKRWRLANWMESKTGTAIGCLLMVAVLLLPAYAFGVPGVTLLFGGVFGFFGGYSFARYEWRKRGYVPKYERLGDQ